MNTIGQSYQAFIDHVSNKQKVLDYKVSS